MSKRNEALIQMSVCAVLWSIAGIFMKWLPWNGFAIASLRSLFAGLTIGIYMFFTKKKFIINKKTVLAGILSGLVYLCFSAANKLTTSANAIVLQFTSPVFIVIFNALFFKIKIKKADLITVILTLFGITLFFFDQLKPGYVLGNFIAIAAGCFMAGMFVSVGNLEEDDRFSSILIGQMFTFIAGFPFVLFTNTEFSIQSIICILVLGIFQLGISYILYIKSSEYCPPLACCLIGVLEPLLNPVWVMIFDGEKPGVYALIGGLLILITITVWCAFFNKNES